MQKTAKQLNAMFGLAAPAAKQAGWDPKEFLEAIAFDVSGGKVERLSCLSFDQANEIIRRLGGEPLHPPGGTGSVQPRRTTNYQRSKAGIPQIVSAAQMRLLKDLASGRGMTDTGLQNLCKTMIKKTVPRTTAEASKIIEAIKAMNKRDQQYGRPTRTKQEAA